MLKRFFFFLPVVVLVVLVGFFMTVLLKQYSSGARSFLVLDSEIIDKPLPRIIVDPLENKQDKQLLSGLRGIDGKPWLLNVWATWCPSCYMEHEFLRTLSSQGVLIVGLNYKDNRRDAKNWLNKFGNPFTINLFDPQGKVGLELGVYGAPETYFINLKGLVAYRHVGQLNPRIWYEKLQAIYQGLAV